MRTTNKPVWHFYLYLIILLVAGGCSDDDIQRNSFGSTLTESGDHLISSFTLPEGKTEFVDDDGIIYFQLRSLSDNSQLDFEGRLKRTSGLLSCDLFIPHGQAIVDGDYVVWIRKEADGDIYPQCYRLTFQDHMVCGVQSSLHQYDQLVGEGTDTNPYLISSTEDFAYLTTVKDNILNRYVISMRLLPNAFTRETVIKAHRLPGYTMVAKIR